VYVSPFIEEYAPIGDILIASVATAWDNPTDGSTVILVINEALYFGNRMEYSLLCPNQLRFSGVIVNDVPPAFSAPDTPHSIVIPGKIEIPLSMRGVMSYLETRRPTAAEIANCEHIELTSDKPWDTHSMDLSQNTMGTSDIIPRRVHLCERSDPPEICVSSLSRFMTGMDESVPVDTGPTIHEADVILIEAEHRVTMSASSGMKTSVITKEDLAKRWLISPETAARTLEVATQMGMRYAEGPLEQRLHTSQAHMRFPSLNIVTYADTMFSSKKSVRGYSCAQVFTDGHYFCRVYPMRTKGDAHHALMLFIHEVGVPKSLLSDRALEEMRGEWGKIVKQYRIDHKTTETKSPWQNRAEAEIHELKRLVHKTLKRSKAPVEMWRFAIEWAAKVRSLTAHDALLLNARTPKERVLGRTPDISEYAHYSWFEWV